MRSTRMALADYAGIVGHLLAKGHARTSGASMIAGYVGGSDKLDRALCRFARAYADQTEADHRALTQRRGARRVTRRGRAALAEPGELRCPWPSADSPFKHFIE